MVRQGGSVSALEAWRWRRTRVDELAVKIADALVQGRGIGDRLVEEYAVARVAELVALNAARAEVSGVVA